MNIASIQISGMHIDLIRHKGQDRISLTFKYDADKISMVKTLPDARWSASMKCWHVADSPETRNALGLEDSNIENKSSNKETVHPLITNHASSADELLRYKRQLEIMAYSKSTQKCYLQVFQLFVRKIAPRHPSSLNKEEILDYLHGFMRTRRPSESYQNVVVNALKFWYEKVEGLPRTHYDLPRPRHTDPLPKVLSKEEVVSMFRLTENLKHRAMLMMAYGAGLRMNELLNLKLTDIDSKRLIIRINRGKGKKDRELPLPNLLLQTLRDYVRIHKPRLWLFEGQEPAKSYTARSAQMVIKQAAKRAGIHKPITMHMLRHSYATHLLESGTDIRYIQEALGHASIRTTEIYTHVAKDRKPASPLENVEL